MPQTQPDYQCYISKILDICENENLITSQLKPTLRQTYRENNIKLLTLSGGIETVPFNDWGQL